MENVCKVWGSEEERAMREGLSIMENTKCKCHERERLNVGDRTRVMRELHKFRVKDVPIRSDFIKKMYGLYINGVVLSDKQIEVTATMLKLNTGR